MAEVVANLRMEYGPNTYTLYRTDESGTPEAFSDDIDNLSFNIERIDNENISRSFIAVDNETDDGLVSSDNLTTLRVKFDLSDEYLRKSDDNVHSPKIDEFRHIYSLVDGTSNVIMSGKVQLFRVAQ